MSQNLRAQIDDEITAALRRGDRAELSPAPAGPLAVLPGSRRRKLLFLVTEDWYFCSHRMGLARAARDQGFAVTVATRIGADGRRIAAEGFRVIPLEWRRQSINPLREAGL